MDADSILVNQLAQNLSNQNGVLDRYLRTKNVFTSADMSAL